jgi:adenosylhomocysteinase
MFKSNEILADKKPINFVLEEPTQLKYLDPVFYLHNKSIEYLITGKPLPPEEDKAVLKNWLDLWKFRVDQLPLTLHKEA